MIFLSVVLGIYAYIIFIIGVLGLVRADILTGITLLYISFCGTLIKRRYSLFHIITSSVKPIKETFVVTFTILILLQVVINLIGALGPELAYDALWYHLTLPKLYLEEQKIFFIPGGLLYYSAMPKLAEMLYIPALAFGNEIAAKVIHFLFGILTTLAVYKTSRTFLSVNLSLFAALIFYSNLVVAWESTTAYSDLIRAFYEILALFAFLMYLEKKSIRWIFLSACMLGFAITTKLLALGSLFIFTLLLMVEALRRKSSKRHLVNHLLLYWSISLLIPFPWFIFSILHIGNPVYPFFTQTYRVEFDMHLLHPIQFFKDIWSIFLYAADPISPLYLITLPLIILLFNQFDMKMKYIGLYSLLALILWYITPRTGGGRFLLPYLPAFSILVAGVLGYLSRKYNTRSRKKSANTVFIESFLGPDDKRWIYTVIVLVTIFVSIISIVYRGAANIKFIPVVLGYQSKHDFLMKHLNFSFGDFYDYNNDIKKIVQPSETVLVLGIHNVYYIDFPFVHISYAQKGITYDYILTPNLLLPKEFSEAQLLYENPITRVKLYKTKGVL